MSTNLSESLKAHGEKLCVRKTASRDSLHRCRGFLRQDPIANVLPLGDLYSPLLQVSDVYNATQDSEIVGVCTICRAFATPSIVFGAAPLNVKRALFEKAFIELPNKFISLCYPDVTTLFKEDAIILHSHLEQQMVTDFSEQIEPSSVKVEKIRVNDLPLLEKFYTEHGAEAWTPLQFKVGPYYCVKDNGTIVSVAGVHLLTPQIAQLGNIVTDEAYQGRGFATACTRTLTADLTQKKRIVSLFVRKDNLPAIHMYEKIGFRKVRDIIFLIMRRITKASSPNDRV